MSGNTKASNATGLRFAEEIGFKTLPGTPIWYPLEPNSYKDFGSDLKLIARNPMNPSRQRKKGVITDLDASGGFTQDLTQVNSLRILQGPMYADWREKATNLPLNGTTVAVSGVASGTKTYTLASGTVGSNFTAGDLVFASGFNQSGNDGLKTVASSTATTVVVNESLSTETPPATAQLQKVGVTFPVGTVDVDTTGSYPILSRSSGTQDFTTLGLIPGEWVFIGSTMGKKFVTAANNGFARVRSVTASSIEFDKTTDNMVNETGTALTVQLFFGNVIKNEKDPTLIHERTYQLERSLGADADGQMSEYLLGAVASELSLAVKQADKVTIDLSFIALDNEQRPGTLGLKSGTRPVAVDAPAFNTSSDFSRIKMHIIQDGVTNPAPLFAFLTELNLTVNNSVTPNKAVGTLGAIDVSAGTFVVNGNVTAYFADIAAVQAVRNNADVAMDFALVKNNAGFVFDIPLIGLGDGRLKVEQDKPITLPLSTEAAEGEMGHTLLINWFPYLPDSADL